MATVPMRDWEVDCRNRALKERHRRSTSLPTGGGSIVVAFIRRPLPHDFGNSPCTRHSTQNQVRTKVNDGSAIWNEVSTFERESILPWKSRYAARANCLHRR